MAERQVKSRQRVADFGEVYTAEREVNAMLDLVKQETERIDSRFLEPACGEGAFLTEILRRKLAAAKKASVPPRRKTVVPDSYEANAVRAVMSIYGVELLEDNTAACRQNLFDIWDAEYTANMKKSANDLCRDVVRYILQKNILCGDALTMRQADGTPIIFAEWSFIDSYRVRRRDYRLDQLLAPEAKPEDTDNLTMEGWEYDSETKAFIPGPLREYPITDYRRVAQYE